MASAERVLNVLEYLMQMGSKPLKQIDIARDLDISPATLNGIIKILFERGFLFRTSEKYCVLNFTFTRNVPMSDAYLALLENITRQMTQDLGVAVEVVVVTGPELLWHSRTEHPDPAVVIRAKAGFRRTLYELDALAALYLGQVPSEQFQSRFSSESFYQTRLSGTRRIEIVSGEAAQVIIESAAGRRFLADEAPNHQGIRRFVTYVTAPDGSFQHLLSIADRVEAGKDDDRVAKFELRLLEAREVLTAQIARETRSGWRPRPTVEGNDQAATDSRAD